MSANENAVQMQLIECKTSNQIDFDFLLIFEQTLYKNAIILAIETICINCVNKKH